MDAAIALARAHMAAGDRPAARKAIAPVWRKNVLSISQERKLLADFGSVRLRRRFPPGQIQHRESPNVWMLVLERLHDPVQAVDPQLDVHDRSASITGDDPHEDLGIISFDKARNCFVYRSFFSEGFVNQYVGKLSDDGKTIEFETEAIENGPPGLRAREVITIEDDQVRSQCLLASGDQPFKVCITLELQRRE